MMVTIPKTQLAATVPAQGGPVVFDEKYPVPVPAEGQVLVKVLYSGVCQSDLHTARGTAAGPDGKPITKIKLPHVGGHEGVGRIAQLGPNVAPSADVDVGTLVGIRFLATVCHACQFCTTGREQHCAKARNHLHHIDGSFQQWCVLDMSYLTVLPPDIDPKVAGPVLCAGLTAYKAVKNAGLKQGEWLTVIGAGGGLGHLAVQYGLAMGARVLGVDAGASKGTFLSSLGAHAFIDIIKTSDIVASVKSITGEDGSHAVIVTSGHPAAFTHAADLLRIGGTLCMVGIPPADVTLSNVSVASVIIRGLSIRGNLVGSLKETHEALALVQEKKVQVRVDVRPFRELEKCYTRLENGDVEGRMVLEIGEDWM